jgi:hypothetical protein
VKVLALKEYRMIRIPTHGIISLLGGAIIAAISGRMISPSHKERPKATISY